MKKMNSIEDLQTVVQECWINPGLIVGVASHSLRIANEYIRFLHGYTRRSGYLASPIKNKDSMKVSFINDSLIRVFNTSENHRGFRFHEVFYDSEIGNSELFWRVRPMESLTYNYKMYEPITKEDFLSIFE